MSYPGVPLVFETFSWEHGVAVGACVKSESTAAAEFTGKNIMHDPMAMRPFLGYNFGKYLDHWLSLNKAPHKVRGLSLVGQDIRVVPKSPYVSLLVY